MNVDSKSNKLTANFSTGMLMRVGSKERLEKCYREKKLAIDVEHIHFYKLPGHGDTICYSIC